MKKKNIIEHQEEEMEEILDLDFDIAGAALTSGIVDTNTYYHSILQSSMYTSISNSEKTTWI